MGTEDKPAINIPLNNITEPGSHDVLSGRGVTTNRHPGNVSYRSLVALNKELYVTSTKKQKMAISRSIVDAVRSMKPPGRFLDKDPETCLWHDIGDRKAIEKTSQALRDGAADLRRQLSQDLGDPDFLNAVFEMDTSNSSAKTTNTEPSKEKAKPVKAKPPIKKGHRRTRSNPHTLAEKKRAVAVKKQKNELAEPVQKPVLSPLNSVGSLPPSPMANRATFGRASSFDYAQVGYHAPPSPSVSSGAPYPHHHVSSPTLKCASFDSATHSWHYGRRHHHHHHHHPGHPPLSPSSLPGRHPLSPPGSYSRPPMSPVHQPWSSPGSYSRSSPGFRSWRASPSPYGYTPSHHGESLSVPALSRQTSESPNHHHHQRLPLSPRVPLSPVHTTSSGAQDNLVHHPPPIMRAGSAEDFVPPPSPGSWLKPRQKEKIIVASPVKPTKMEIDKDDDMKYQSPTCTLFGSCFMMDTEYSDVEVVLSKDNKGHVVDVNPADKEDEKKERDFSPLPFLTNESESSSTSFFETLLQLPIAPCAPQDVE